MKVRALAIPSPLCRNVLIYFDVDTRKKTLGEIRSVLGSGGRLLLGCAESTLNLDNSFAKSRRPSHFLSGSVVEAAAAVALERNRNTPILGSGLL